MKFLTLAAVLITVLIPAIAHASDSSSSPDEDGTPYQAALARMQAEEYKLLVHDPDLLKKANRNPMAINAMAMDYCNQRGRGDNTQVYTAKFLKRYSTRTDFTPTSLREHLSAIINSAVRVYCPVYRDF